MDLNEADHYGCKQEVGHHGCKPEVSPHGCKQKADYTPPVLR